jgi:hypothetical protein
MAKVSFGLDALKAQFAAKGGKATVVESGVRAIESDRTIYAAMREGKRAMADAVVETHAMESLFERQQQAFHAAKADGWSTQAAHDYAESAV